MNERELFIAALQHHERAERAAYLARACAADDKLRQRIEGLLEQHALAGEFLERAAVNPLHAPQREARGNEENASPGNASALERPSTGRNGPGSESASLRIGSYKLLQMIGEGGMGTVWMAEQQEPVRRLVAVKLIRAGMDDPRLAARFEAERQALALMDHPNIAKVLDAGTTENGRLYFVMDLVKGTPIVEYCDHQRLTLRSRLGLFVQICRAIQHAHQKGIIHRDIKPSNVLVAPFDGRPVVKVIDFGVAKAIGQRLTERTLYTEFGAVVGTLEYMSPEQAELNNQDVDTRSDVYSLGVMLYELLTGTTPLTKERLKQVPFSELLRLIREEEPPKPSTRLSASKTALPAISAQRQSEPRQLPGLMRRDLDWIVMKSLEKDRSRRYETANSLARDVERFLHDEPVEACPPSTGYQLRKFARRYRGPLIAASLVAALLVIGVTVSTWMAVRAAVAESREKIEAEKAKQAAAESRAVLTFFRDQVLAAARPDGLNGGLGTEVTIRSALDAAAPKIETAFRNQPAVEAAIRRVLGQTYRHLGEQKLAIPHLERARDLQAIALGPDDPTTLATQNELAMAYWGAGRLNDVIPLLEHYLAAEMVYPGADAPQTLATRNDLGVAYMENGRFDLAIPLIQQTLKARTALLGADHPDTLCSRSALATAYQSAGRLDIAIPLFEQTLAERAAKLGPENPNTLITQNKLAVAYQAAGQLDRAIDLLERTLKARVAKLGVNHPETMITRNNLARAYDAAGEDAKAESLYRDVLEQRRKKRGTQHPHVAVSLDDLGWYLARHQRHGEAEPLLRECLAIREKVTPDDWTRFNVESRLGGVLLSGGRFSDAEPLLLHGYEGLEVRDSRIPAAFKSSLYEASARVIELYDRKGDQSSADAWRKKLAAVTLPGKSLSAKNDPR
jgi:non-specific serine/threonine protein kinase/serine/threonine-protein kinase